MSSTSLHKTKTAVHSRRPECSRNSLSLFVEMQRETGSKLVTRKFLSSNFVPAFHPLELFHRFSHFCKRFVKWCAVHRRYLWLYVRRAIGHKSFLWSCESRNISPTIENLRRSNLEVTLTVKEREKLAVYAMERVAKTTSPRNHVEVYIYRARIGPAQKYRNSP